MDGRADFEHYCDLPPGVMWVFNCLGGIVNLGGYVGTVLRRWTKRTNCLGKACVIFVTYHFSKGSKERCCAGFNNDTDAAIANARETCNRISRIFKTNPATPIVIGLETDEESFVLHGGDNKRVSIADLSVKQDVASVVYDLLLGMDRKIQHAVIFLFERNFDHVQAIRKSGRLPEEAVHREFIYGVGFGHDGLHAPNTAIVQNTIDTLPLEEVSIAANLIVSSWSNGRINHKQGILFMAATACWDPYNETEWYLMVERSYYITQNILPKFTELLPEKLQRNLQVLVGVQNMDTRQFVEQPYPLSF